LADNFASVSGLFVSSLFRFIDPLKISTSFIVKRLFDNPSSKSSSSPFSFKYLKLSDLAGLVPGNRPSNFLSLTSTGAFAFAFAFTAAFLRFAFCPSARSGENANRVLALTAPVRVDRDRGFALLSPPRFLPLTPRPFVGLDVLGRRTSTSSSLSLSLSLSLSRASVVGDVNRTAPIPVLFGVDAGLTTCTRSNTGAPGSACDMVSPVRTFARARALGRRRVTRA
jgi:hypothetical protein